MSESLLPIMSCQTPAITFRPLLTLLLCAVSPLVSLAEVLVEFDAAASGTGITPDMAQPPWDVKRRPMTNTGKFLLQDTTSEYPQTAAGIYVSPPLFDLMLPGSGEYGIEFKVRPLDDIRRGTDGSLSAGLAVDWGDSERSFRVVIDKSSEDKKESSIGDLVVQKGKEAVIVAKDIDWSEARSVFIGYRGIADEFDVYIDGKLVNTIAAPEIASTFAHGFAGKVAFGDFISGPSLAFNADVRAEWHAVRIHDSAAPVAAAKSHPQEVLSQKIDGEPVPVFSSLEPTKQLAIRTAVAPPTLALRVNPYSTPMYFPMWLVKDNNGRPMCGSSPDGKFHPEWQEALIRDWAELGMTRLHLSLAPEGNGTENRSYNLSDLDRAGLTELSRLARAYGMKVGLRIDLPMSSQGYWLAHPRNPENELEFYKRWINEVIEVFGGQAEYLILGDEIDTSGVPREDGRGWTKEDFLNLIKNLAQSIRAKDPAVKISTPAYGAAGWGEVMELVNSDFRDFGDAIAINIEDTPVLPQYAEQLRNSAKGKDLIFLSNGVGYVSSDTKLRNPPTEKGYFGYPEAEQAGLIARAMYLSWSAKLAVAPYYITVRNIDYKGDLRPMWYGFFGFEDMIIDSNDRASFKHYPGWFAFQTVASVFYDVNAFQDPAFAVKSSSKKTSYIKAHERKDGTELLVILWGIEGPTNITIDSDKYAYPVKVDLLNKDRWEDVRAIRQNNRLILPDLPMQGSRFPIILRLISNQLAPS